MNDDVMGGGPFLPNTPFDPPQNPNQDALRRMMAEMLATQYQAPRPDGSVGSRNFMEALTPMSNAYGQLPPERGVQGPGMADVNNAGSVTPEDLNRQRLMAQHVMQNYAPPMRRPMR